jgi:hypothetical protein
MRLESEHAIFDVGAAESESGQMPCHGGIHIGSGEDVLNISIFDTP